MADTIIIRCAWCGEKIGEISYVKGEQVIGCSCGGRTVVTIYDSGSVHTERGGHK